MRLTELCLGLQADLVEGTASRPFVLSVSVPFQWGSLPLLLLAAPQNGPLQRAISREKAAFL